ncbi:MAG: cytochrome C [Rhodospirillaceae bacterium]|nr:cytochrome C [Rhodospirillaceae bacterium]
MTQETAQRDKMQQRVRALARLGLVAGAIYVAPALTTFSGAQASGAIGYASDAVTVNECGACHAPYGPRFLPAYSWNKIMGDLGNHFGEDASLDEASRKHILAYMVGKNSIDIPIRITERTWFVRIHKKSVSQADRAAAGKMSNCQACHKK